MHPEHSHNLRSAVRLLVLAAALLLPFPQPFPLI